MTTRKKARALEGHGHIISSLVWSPDGDELISGSEDMTIRAWRVATGKQLEVMEGHTDLVDDISLSSDGRVLASKSSESVRLWDARTKASLVTLSVKNAKYGRGLAFSPCSPMLASPVEDRSLQIWKVDVEGLLEASPAVDGARYTTAKLVLVGDSGVGKTGLGWRIAHSEFKEHHSTHGQQFWVIDELGKTRDDGTDCEAVLWDLAGQPDYRLVHSLFVDDVDAALVLFDPANRQEPLAGVEFWLNQLAGRGDSPCNSILVGARTDRGTATLTAAELEAFCERKGVHGGYVATSALMGDGVPELMERLKALIPWDEKTATVTTQTFKRVKEFVLRLKEESDAAPVLVDPAELQTRLEAENPDGSFEIDETMTAVGHLANLGYVALLRGSEGGVSILLAPDRLANLASSIVLEARRNPRGLGVLEESRLLAGGYRFPELTDLGSSEREILLDAAAARFLENNLCFRETFNRQTFLVFPSLINEKRPKTEEIEIVEDVSYRLTGAVEKVYASLVVLLGYTNTFVRTHQWQNQAQYEMGEGEVCGFRMVDSHEGELELLLYYVKETPDPVRTTFRGLFERFLTRQELNIARYRPAACGDCGSRLARNVVLSQLDKGKRATFCHECGAKVELALPEEVSRLTPREKVMVDAEQRVAELRTAFETSIVRLKALLRDRGREEAPTCFISYAWGEPSDERWVLQLAKDLRNAGVAVLLDRWDCRPGTNLDRYIERILASDYVVPVGTPELVEKYEAQKTDPVVAAELNLINLRVRQPNEYGETVLPVLLKGEQKTALTPQLRTLVSVDFRESSSYFGKLLEIVWRIHGLPADSQMLDELRSEADRRSAAS